MFHNFRRLSGWVALVVTVEGCAKRTAAPAPPEAQARGDTASPVVEAPATVAQPSIRTAIDMCDRHLALGVAAYGSVYLSRFSRFTCVQEHEVLLAKAEPAAIAPYAACLEQADDITALNECDVVRPAFPLRARADCERLDKRLRAIVAASGAVDDAGEPRTLSMNSDEFIRECVETIPEETFACLDAVRSIDDLVSC